MKNFNRVVKRAAVEKKLANIKAELYNSFNCDKYVISGFDAQISNKYDSYTIYPEITFKNCPKFDMDQAWFAVNIRCENTSDVNPEFYVVAGLDFVNESRKKFWQVKSRRYTSVKDLSHDFEEWVDNDFSNKCRIGLDMGQDLNGAYPLM